MEQTAAMGDFFSLTLAALQLDWSKCARTALNLILFAI
jgi:hypothetical protein